MFYLDIFRHIDCWVNVAPNEVGMVRKPANTKDHDYHHHHFHDLKRKHMIQSNTCIINIRTKKIWRIHNLQNVIKIQTVTFF